MRTKIEQIAYHLPERVVTNQELRLEHPSWDVSRAEKYSGVLQRYIANDDETALDLAFEACQKLFGEYSGLGGKIDAILFCTQSEDYIMPPNSCVLHEKLDLPENVLAFDFNLACSGYVYGLALAQGLICSGMAENILLVNADTYSKYIHKDDRSTRLLFGDGAAATWVTTSVDSAGIIDIQCATSGKGYGKLVVLWDGTVIPCCVDYNATLALGNVRNKTIPNLWKNDEIVRLREQHLNGEFPDTCANCNECESTKVEKRFFVNSKTI